jgi:hypothetical protein
MYVYACIHVYENVYECNKISYKTKRSHIHARTYTALSLLQVQIYIHTCTVAWGIASD